jgi:hypothetical protein
MRRRSRTSRPPARRARRPGAASAVRWTVLLRTAAAGHWRGNRAVDLVVIRLLPAHADLRYRVACIPRQTASGRLHATAVRGFCLVPGTKHADATHNMAGREAALAPGSASRRQLRFEAETDPAATRAACRGSEIPGPARLVVPPGPPRPGTRPGRYQDGAPVPPTCRALPARVAGATQDGQGQRGTDARPAGARDSAPAAIDEMEPGRSQARWPLSGRERTER